MSDGLPCFQKIVCTQISPTSKAVHSNVAPSGKLLSLHALANCFNPVNYHEPCHMLHTITQICDTLGMLLTKV